MQQTRLLLHGTTVGTNAIVQLKGVKTGLITTRGHGDALIMMRSVGRSAGLPIEKLLHVSRHQKPAPIIPRTLIQEVSERMDWKGEMFLPLNIVKHTQPFDTFLSNRWKRLPSLSCGGSSTQPTNWL